MFDDQPNQPSANVPPNLPIGEPEDIFANADKNSGESIRATGDGVMDQTSALEAGILRPKTAVNNPSNMGAPVSPRSVMNVPTPPMPQAQENYDLKEPGIGKFLFKLFGILIVVAVLGGGGWFLYSRFFQQNNTDINTGAIIEESESPSAIITSTTEEEQVATPNGGSQGEKIDAMAEDIQDDEILFGAPVDRDGDNIDDTRETQIGTNPNNWDTDGDGLSDGDEILIWKTDPLKSDTDGDSYPDGSEVKNGYSPLGPGKLFNPPTTTTSSVEVSALAVPSVTAGMSTGTVVSMPQSGSMASSSVTTTSNVKK
ncbi:MAG TPA: hypothetical protein PLV72_02930 [Candidatus Magasanikbacteria bacterium]|nr:hypothetical protein [Candidatus Magasanikbacteria bacterium]